MNGRAGWSPDKGAVRVHLLPVRCVLAGLATWLSRLAVTAVARRSLCRSTGDCGIENLLPDSEEIRRRVAASAAADGTDAFSLLGAIGRDCVGAMQFLPDGIDPGAAGEIVGVAVDHSGIAEMVSELPEVPLGVRPGGRFRISLAGAQHKMALMFREGEWHIPSGSTPTTHILKPPIGLLDNGIDLSRSVENEHFCMKLLAGLGLGVANTEIVDFESQRVLVVERFDRLWTRDGRLLRIPQEDCCQALSVPRLAGTKRMAAPELKSCLTFQGE